MDSMHTQEMSNNDRRRVRIHCSSKEWDFSLKIGFFMFYSCHLGGDSHFGTLITNLGDFFYPVKVMLTTTMVIGQKIKKRLIEETGGKRQNMLQKLVTTNIVCKTSRVV